MDVGSADYAWSNHLPPLWHHLETYLITRLVAISLAANPE
jgi:hypothetical protein